MKRTNFAQTVFPVIENFLHGLVCESWKEHTKNTRPKNINGSEPPTDPPDNRTHDSLEDYTGSYVAALYDKWYIAKVVEIHEKDGNLEVSFMERKKAWFILPDHEDKLLIEPTEILCKVSSPVPTGKFVRMFKLQTADLDKLTEYFEAHV